MAQTNVQAFSGDVAISSNLAVDTNTLFVDSVGNKVGIGTDVPSSKLTVNQIPDHRGTYDHSLAPMTVTNRTATSSTTLNDPKDVLNLAREGRIPRPSVPVQRLNFRDMRITVLIHELDLI